LRRTGEHIECLWCNATLDGVPEGARIRTALMQSGGGPTERAILVDGREIHRCERNGERIQPTTEQAV
jgi:hypothetical protein